ncbi:MAG: BPL-N domain-containing protein [Kiritimatiellae bacterium]|nr:BPL-N domain-containing protein [Kiritimatiellia bacterium]
MRPLVGHMLVWGLLLGVLAGCATTEKPIEAMTSATPPLKVAVFADEGPGGIGAVEWARLVKTSPEMTLTLVDGKDVAAGKLAGQDVLVMPGGASKKEFQSLGPQGVARMKDFIREGGAYFGTCAGCCLLMSAPSNRACVIPWNTKGAEGLLFPNIALNEKGAKALGLKAGNHVVRYHGGPLMRPTTNVIDGAKFELWGTMNAEATLKGKVDPKKQMHGAAAIVGGTYGKGRVFVTSVHPEYFDGSLYFVTAAFKWLTDRTVTFPAKRRIPNMTAVGFLGGSLLRSTAEVALAIDGEADYDLVAINGDSIWKNALRHLDVVVIPSGVTKKNNHYQALSAYIANGGQVVCYGKNPDRLPGPDGAIRCTAAEVLPTLRRLFPKN